MKRANYQTLVWRNALVQFFYLSDPTEYSWRVSPSAGLAIQWCAGYILPRDLQDLSSEIDDDQEDDNERMPSNTDFTLSDDDYSDTAEEQ